MNRIWKTAALAAVSSAALVAGSAAAAPVLWGGNGHYYEYFGSSVSWTDALTLAGAASFVDGASTYNGYLATITSDGENAFIAANIVNDGWIGGSDQDDEGFWRWMAGPEIGQLFYQAGVGTVTYAHWNGGEPNNLGNEDYLQLQGGNWNDLPNGSSHGYIVEYQAVSNGVPEPATWALMILGFGSAGMALRSQRRLSAA